MLSKLLVATDGSDASDAALECLRELGRVGTRDIVLVHVFNVYNVGGLYLSLQRLLLPRIQRQQAMLTAAGFRVSIETPLGVPHVEINRIAMQEGCGGIAIGSHGAGMVEEALIGSTASSVIHHAELPVLLVRLQLLVEDDRRRCRSACEAFFKHVLFPTDFSDAASKAFRYLEHVVAETRGAVTLLHVQDRTRIHPHLEARLDEFSAIDRDRMGLLRDRLLGRGAPRVDIEIPYGLPKEIVLERSRNGGFSLIVMGSQGRGVMKEMVLGSLANHVARHAPLPVLFVPCPGSSE